MNSGPVESQTFTEKYSRECFPSLWIAAMRMGPEEWEADGREWQLGVYDTALVKLASYKWECPYELATLHPIS